MITSKGNRRRENLRRYPISAMQRELKRKKQKIEEDKTLDFIEINQGAVTAGEVLDAGYERGLQFLGGIKNARREAGFPVNYQNCVRQRDARERVRDPEGDAIIFQKGRLLGFLEVNNGEVTPEDVASMGYDLGLKAYGGDLKAACEDAGVVYRPIEEPELPSVQEQFPQEDKPPQYPASDDSEMPDWMESSALAEVTDHELSQLDDEGVIEDETAIGEYTQSDVQDEPRVLTSGVRRRNLEVVKPRGRSLYEIERDKREEQQNPKSRGRKQGIDQDDEEGAMTKLDGDFSVFYRTPDEKERRRQIIYSFFRQFREDHQQEDPRGKDISVAGLNSYLTYCGGGLAAPSRHGRLGPDRIPGRSGSWEQEGVDRLCGTCTSANDQSRWEAGTLPAVPPRGRSA